MPLYPESDQKLHLIELLQHNPQSLSINELLRTLLNSTNEHGIDTLITRFGNIQSILKASYAQFRQNTMLNSHHYTQLQAAKELTRRALFEPLQRQPLTTSSLANYLISELNHQTQEIFTCLFLDKHTTLLRFEKLFSGSLNMAIVQPRLIAKHALELDASAVIVAHNHPSGILAPSLEDQRVTEHIVQVLSIFDIELLDHLIVANSKTFSFKQHGLL